MANKSADLTSQPPENRKPSLRIFSTPGTSSFATPSQPSGVIENVTQSLSMAASNQPAENPKPSSTEIKSDLSSNAFTPALDNAQRLKSSDFPNAPIKDKGAPPVTIANIRYLLKMYDISVRYNVIKKKLEVRWAKQSGTTDNRDNVALTTILSLAALNRMNAGQVPAILEAIADRTPYNPVADWISSKPWDGIDRLQAFQDTLVEREGFPRHLKEKLMYRWLVSAVAAALMPNGFYGRGILTLQGPQSIGKTSWIRAMIPDPILREQAVKLDHHLDAGNKDSLITAVTHWVVEIGELDSSLKKDVARLKGFITSDRDKLRRPYGRADSEYQRRTVFCASVNDHAFLVDPTGNTRFWTIPVTKIDYQHTIDMQQLFAQIAKDFENGEQWWLNEHEEALLEHLNQDHRAVSVIRERLMGAIDHGDVTCRQPKAYSATEALQNVGLERPSNQQCKEAGGILRELFGDPKKIQGIYRWRVPFQSDKPTKFDKLLPDPDDNRF